VTYDTELLEGSPAEAVLEVARSRDVDLIVIGSRRLGAVRGALLRRVSSEIVHHADRPVLVARSIELARLGRSSRFAV
jgi:nucleotide-binding universal stress UspA family protein